MVDQSEVSYWLPGGSERGQSVAWWWIRVKSVIGYLVDQREVSLQLGGGSE